MPHSPPPDWSNWPPSSHPAPDFMNGHDLHLGQTLGLLLANTDRQTRVLERISDRIDDLPEDLAKAIQPPPIQPSDLLSSRDKVQLALAALIVVLALAGKVTILEVVQLLAKPLGM